MSKILFSLTVYEQADTVLNQIRNIKHFVSQSLIVIHVNSNSNELFDKLNIDTLLLNDVYLTPHRVNSDKGEFCLDLAHSRNFQYAIELNLDFDYFVLEASNSLILRYGMQDYIEKFDIGCNLNKLRVDSYGIWNQKVFNHYSFSLIRSKYEDLGIDSAIIYKSMHEGTFYKKHIATFIFDFIDTIRDLCKKNNDLPNYPTEEFWFPFAVKCYLLSNPNIRISHPITYMPWHRRLAWTDEDINEFLFSDDLKDYYSIKRIDRNPKDPLRLLIQDIFNY